MGVVSFSPDMNTVTQVRHDKRVIQWEQGDCREYLSCFNNNTNTFSDFTTDVFKMRWPFEGVIYDNSQKFSKQFSSTKIVFLSVNQISL